MGLGEGGGPPHTSQFLPAGGPSFKVSGRLRAWSLLPSPPPTDKQRRLKIRCPPQERLHHSRKPTLEVPERLRLLVKSSRRGFRAAAPTLATSRW